MLSFYSKCDKTKYKNHICEIVLLKSFIIIEKIVVYYCTVTIDFKQSIRLN